jgi:uncharacterized DUF497 family protein
MEGDDFEWDDRKAAINFRRHKVSFRRLAMSSTIPSR